MLLSISCVKVQNGDIMKDKMKGILSLLVATVIWGSTFVAQSVGMDHIGPFTFQAVRCFLAVLVLLPTIAIFDGKQIKAYFQKWRDKKLWKASLLCGAALFVAAGLQQMGLVYTDAGKAGFLTAMYIVLVPFMGLFFRRKPGFMAIISIFIAVVGLYLLSCVGVTQINIGDIFVFLSAFAFAAQITLVDRYVGQVDGLRLSCLQSLVCSLSSAVVMFLWESPALENIVDCWFPLCYGGILSMGLAYSLQIVGQKHLESVAASMIMSLESVFALITGWLFLNETLTHWEAIGCFLVFSAVILSQIPVKLKTKAP